MTHPRDWRDTLSADDTLDPAGSITGEPVNTQLMCLTLLLHPDLRRIGERAWLPPLCAGHWQPLSRLEPLFSRPGRDQSKGIADPFLSRRPIHLRPHAKGIAISRGESRTRVLIDGQPVESEHWVSNETLTRGALIELAGRIALLLHLRSTDTMAGLPDFGLVGCSDAIDTVRAEITRVLNVPYPVLLRGETGTGKELVAAAIHRWGRRADHALVTVNMGSIPPSLAASELFGHARGAFSGAIQDHHGHFERAHGGTLFLDEVGDTPADVQTMLLRALEAHEILRVGGRRPIPVDVRFVAATDAHIEDRIKSGAFRAPLFHRLSAYTIRIPPLRERPDDIGLLFAHFIREGLREIDALHLMTGAATASPPWIPTRLMRRLVSHHWPGNVRELRNVVRQAVVRSRNKAQLQLRASRLPVPTGLSPASPGAARPPLPPCPPEAGPVAYRRRIPSQIGDSELIETLAAHEWRVGPTATALGIPKSSLYYLMDKCAEVRKAGELSAEELQAAHVAFDGDLSAMSAALKVSRRGIQLRRRELGLKPPAE